MAPEVSARWRRPASSWNIGAVDLVAPADVQTVRAVNLRTPLISQYSPCSSPGLSVSSRARRGPGSCSAF